MSLSKLILLLLVVPVTACSHSPKAIQPSANIQKESPERWYQQGADKVQQLVNKRVFPKKAKNVILFVGDGMGITTITAARILEGQQAGGFGEENQLSFEKFPQTALAKTYNTNFQSPDSAGTMSAMMTGIKTKGLVVSVDGSVNVGDCESGKGRERITLLQLAESAGMSTGAISTTRLTHPTPAATYAHSVSRYWESDSKIPAAERAKGCKDIAAQLIDFSYGNGLEVAMGGGRINFIPVTLQDPEYTNIKGSRLDNRNLMNEWNDQYKNSAVVWNKSQFDAIDTSKTTHLLGLFEPSHMQYEYDRKNDKAGEPSLSAMTEKSLKILQNTKKPFFLMVEAGRIDHSHHVGSAFRALTDTIELSNAVQVALNNVNLDETLIIVTSDHSHTFSMGGYPQRGNPILGIVKTPNKAGEMVSKLAKDTQGKPYTTLGYANGPGYVNGDKRPDLTHVDVQAPDYKQAATYPLQTQSHSGVDVAVYATGAGSQIVHGTIEQNVIFHIMKYALSL